MNSKNVDILSSLPEEILSKILSSMPTKFAVRTSILSKTWKYNWMSVTNLDFDDIHPFHDSRILSKFVRLVMKLCRSSQIQLFRLHFSNKWVQQLRVSSWIDKAISLNVRELDIQVVSVELPLSLFTCTTLTKLRLDDGDYYGEGTWKCPSSVYLPCMKTLEIVVYTSPCANVFILIGGCPTLESLSLEVRWCNEDKEDYIFNIPTLKRLKLTWAKCNSVINKVVLNVPNLEHIFLGGMLCSVFVMKDLSSLVEASVSFSEKRFDKHCLWVELLMGLSGVKSLSVEKFLSTSPLPIFPNLKHLELKSFLHSGHILRFLESCPELKHLYIEEKQIYAWVESKSVPVCMLTNLTTITFSICKWWKRDICYLKYMLRNAKVLKTITIISKGSSDIKEEARLCAKLFALPRASKCCEIRIRYRGNWSLLAS